MAAEDQLGGLRQQPGAAGDLRPHRLRAVAEAPSFWGTDGLVVWGRGWQVGDAVLRAGGSSNMLRRAGGGL